MPPDRTLPGSPDDWLRHARSDLALAGMRKTKNLLYEHLCFHAQHAAEKALKAVLVQHGVRAARTHDLAYLIQLLPSEISISPALIDLPVLTKYAVEQRYPGESIRPTARDRRDATRMAEHTVLWATSQLVRFNRSKRGSRT